uniref:Carbohydrate sulfotransferase n=1 Tax=Glossina brevipalpis TaxID=37001 RepID=A0A1A9WL28_9MUSC
MTKSSTTTTKTNAKAIPTVTATATATATATCFKSQLVNTSMKFSSMSCNRFFNRFNRQSLLIFLAALLFLSSLQIPVIRGAFEDGNNNNVKITEHSLELTQTINMQRQEYMQKQCETLGYNILDLNDLTEQQMEHMIVDRKHKLLYCYVPKITSYITDHIESLCG